MTEATRAPAVMVTRNVWNASFLLAHGLELVRLERRPAGRGFSVSFVFRDPDGRGPALADACRRDADLARLLHARRLEFRPELGARGNKAAMEQAEEVAARG